MCGGGGEFFSFFFRGVGLVLDSLGRWPFARLSRGVHSRAERGGAAVCRCLLLSYRILFCVQPSWSGTVKIRSIPRRSEEFNSSEGQGRLCERTLPDFAYFRLLNALLQAFLERV